MRKGLLGANGFLAEFPVPSPQSLVSFAPCPHQPISTTSTASSPKKSALFATAFASSSTTKSFRSSASATSTGAFPRSSSPRWLRSAFSARICPKSGGLKSPLMCLTQARYGISWGAIGAAMACYEEALSYSRNRVMFDKPLAAFQLQQARLAEMVSEIVKAQLVSLHLGRLKDLGKMTPQQVSLAKRNNVNMATNIAREARRLLGANGILAEYASMRHMANLESVYTYEGTHDVHTLILGQAVTGINAFN